MLFHYTYNHICHIITFRYVSFLTDDHYTKDIQIISTRTNFLVASKVAIKVSNTSTTLR